MAEETPTVTTPTETSAAPATPTIDFASQPWLYRDDKGTWLGKGAEKPENIPGTPEYEVTKTERVKDTYSWLWDKAKNVGFYNEDTSQAIFGIPASRLSANSDERNRQIEDAAWGVIKVKIPESQHNAQVVANKLLPVAKMQMDADTLSGVRYPKAFGMDDGQLRDFVMNPSNGINPDIAFEVIREIESPGYAEQKRSIGTSLVAHIRKAIAPVDHQLVVGKSVYELGPDYLAGLGPTEQRDAFRAMARFKASQKTNITGDAFNAGAQFVQDGIEALVGFGDAVNPFTNADEYLSQRYRDNPELRSKAEAVITRASIATRGPIQRLKEVQRLGNPEAFANTLDHFTNSEDSTNIEFLSAIAELKALREDGAFAQGKPFEKLASFGSGVLQSVVNFKHFINDSTDPNSFLFLREAGSDKYTGQMKVTANVIETLKAIPGAFTSDYWDKSDDQSVDQAIKTWSENHRNITGAHDNVVARAYAALDMPNRAKEARTAYGDEKLAEQASMIYDPITLASGGAGLIGKIAGTAGKVALSAELTAKGTALALEGKSILATLKNVNIPVEAADVSQIVQDIAKATGRTITNEEAMLLSLSGSGEDMLSAQGKTAASNIKTAITGSELPEGLADRIVQLNADAVKHASEVKAAIGEGAKGPKRIISGWLGNGVGAVIETIPGRGMRKMGEFMAEGGAERALGKWGIRRLLELQPRQYVTGFAAVGGGTWAITNAVNGNEWYSGAGLALFGSTALMRPNILTATGTAIENYGKVQRRIAKAAISGERVSGSPIQAALNAARTELGTTSDIAKRASIESEMKMMSWMVDSGFEAAAQAGFHVVVDNVIHGGTVGMTMSWMNDQAAAGSGFGIGAAASTGMAGLNRVTQTANRFTSDATRSKEVIANVSGIINDLKPEQAARVRDWLNGATDFNDFMRRADSFRRVYDATGGRVVASTAAEMEVVNRGIGLDPKDVNRLREEATALSLTPAQAVEHVRRGIEELQSKNQDILNRDETQRRLTESNRRFDASNGLIQDLKGKIAAEEALLAKAGKSSSIVLERLKNDLNNEEVKNKVYAAEGAQLSAQYAEASRKVDAPITFRKGETRVNAAGNQVTMVREGMYIENGPQGGMVHFDISKADAFTVNHEAWEALLHNDAVRPMIPQLTKVLWNKPTEGGRISPAARSAFFDAYASSLSLEDGKRYREQLATAKKEYEDNGRSAGLERYTREAMAWWMATIDSNKPVGYGGIGPSKALTNVRGAGFFDAMRRITVGERSLYDVLSTENVRTEFAALFDPEIGIYPRQYTASMINGLREQGMRFIKQSDGTVRGFFLNNKGEIVRDPIVNSLYDAIYRMTGGKGSPRLTDLNFNQLTHAQQAQLFTATGLSWLVDPTTNTPIPGIPSQPSPQKPTAPGTPTAGTPIDTYNGQPVVPGVNPPKPTAPTGQPQQPVVPTPKPATQTPAGTPIPPPPAPTATGGTATPVTPTTQVPIPQAPVTPQPANPSRMPPVGVVIGGHAQVVLDALTNVPESNRGFRWSYDSSGPNGKGQKTVIWGKPTAAEINALAGAQGLPDVIRNNMLMMANVMAQGGERPILTGRYVNIFSRNQSLYTDARYYVGKEGFQFVSDRTFVPLYFESVTQYRSTLSPDKILSQGQYDALSESKKGEYVPQNNLTTKVFNISAFQDNKNVIFTDGVRVYDKDGGFTYLKDINGRELNPTAIRDIFRDDTEFFTLANDWLQHYNSGGPIDPTGVHTPEGNIVEPSAIRLGNGDRALGEARLTVLRAAFGMTVRNGRIVVNPTTFTNQATRGLAFPYENLSISTMGELSDTGGRSLISQEATTRGQFNMSPASWQLRTAEFTSSFVGETSAFNKVKMWSLPNIPNTHIVETSSPGSKWNTYDIIVDGDRIRSGAKTFDEAKQAAQSAVIEAQNMADARAYAEKVIKEEAARTAREQAQKNATEEAARKKTERERTKAEADLLKETRRNNATWMADAERQAKLDADILAAHEKETQRIAREKAKYEAQLRKLEEKEAKKYEAEYQRLLEEERRNEAVGEKLRQEQIAREAEQKRNAELLRRDIETRTAERAKQDDEALAAALRGNTTELDVGETLRRSLGVDPAGLPVAAENRLVIRRVINQKPIVTQTLQAKQQVGPAVDQTQGNMRVAWALGSEESRAAAPALNKYLNREMMAGAEVMRAINDVWKTELGNQLHSVYMGLDALGKPKYQYHLYGVNGQELYRTDNAIAMYKNMVVQEQRLRGQTTAKAPTTQGGATALQTEVMRQMMPESYLQSQKTTIQRRAESEVANRYRNK